MSISTLAPVAILFLYPALVHADEPEPVKVPFELLKTQHMVVQVKVNGKGPYRVIFDTGAPTTLLNNKVAKESGLIPKDFRKPFFTPFGSLGDFKIKSLQLGELKASDLPAIVMDHPTVSLISKVLGPVEGILGFPFFARYRMTIDYQTKTMTFVPTTYKPANMMEKMMKLVLATNNRKVLAPAGLWGFRVGKEPKDTQPGVDVREVVPGSVAAKAGLQAGDRLLTLGGRWTDSIVDCYQAAGHIAPGREVALLIRRDGNEKQLTVKVLSGL
jgi:hypothetical protein